MNQHNFFKNFIFLPARTFLFHNKTINIGFFIN